MNNQINISIIIVSWNVKDLLYKCLKSIAANRGDLNLEIIVIDNASTDVTQQMLDKFKCQLPNVNCQMSIVKNKLNKGFARANNQGIKIATGKYILVLNPDTEILPNTLQEMYKFFEQHSDCGIASCKHLNPDRTLQPSIRHFPTFWSQFLILHKIHHLLPNLRTFRYYFARDFDYDKTQTCDQAQGSFFMISRKLIERIGLFDNKFFIWFEEVDYCKRAQNAGFKIYYNSKASLIHHGAQSFKQVMTLKKQKIFNKSLLYYIKKHHGFWPWFSMLSAHFNSLILAWITSTFRRKN
jgi:GT2 family glycosyltransferase